MNQSIAKVIAVGTNKGGTGKTTTAIALARGFEREGKRSIVIGFDEQGDFAVGMGIPNPDDIHGIADVLMERCKGNNVLVTNYLYTVTEYVYMLIANGDLASLDVELALEPDRRFFLSELLQPLKGYVDYIIIDCMPHLGALTASALIAADTVIIPSKLEHYSILAVGKFMAFIDDVKTLYNRPNLQIAGILPTAFDVRTVEHKNGLLELYRLYGSFTNILENIPISTDVSRCSKGSNLYDLLPENKAAAAYLKLTKNIIVEGL